MGSVELQFNLAEIAEIIAYRQLRVLFSACLVGNLTGWDGNAYPVDIIKRIHDHQHVTPITYCPEAFSFGVPREFCSIHGGDGFDVLDGKAKLLTVTGVDWTEGAIKAADEAIRVAQAADIDFAIMLDISPSCGSHFIVKGPPERKEYLAAAGVTVAAMTRAGIPVYSSRQYRYLGGLLSVLDPDFKSDEPLINLTEGEWYLNYFGRDNL